MPFTTSWQLACTENKYSISTSDAYRYLYPHRKLNQNISKKSVLNNNVSIKCKMRSVTLYTVTL